MENLFLAIGGYVVMFLFIWMRTEVIIHRISILNNNIYDVLLYLEEDDDNENQDDDDNENQDDDDYENQDDDDSQESSIKNNQQDNTEISQKQLSEHKTIDDIINFLNKPQELTQDQKNFSRIINHLNSLPETKRSEIVVDKLVNKFPKEKFLEKISQDLSEEDFKDLWDIMNASSKRMVCDSNFANQYFKIAANGKHFKDSLNQISEIGKFFNKNFSLPNITLQIGTSFKNSNINVDNDDDDVNAALSLIKNTSMIEDVTNNQ